LPPWPFDNRQSADASGPQGFGNVGHDVGVAVTSLPGRPGFHRVRTPQVDHHQVAAIIRATAPRRADPGVLLAEQAPGLRVVPPMPPPGDAA